MRPHMSIFRPARSLRALAASMVVLMAATGCISGAGGDEPAQRSSEIGGEVEWWTINLQANYSDYIQGLIDTYEEQHPGTTIKWVDVPGADLATKLLAALASGEPPDLVNIASADLGRFQKSLTDLNDHFAADDLDAYQPSLVEPLKKDDALTALPWYNGGSPVMAYRKSAMAGTSFDAANPPATLDEVLELAAEVKQKSGVAGMNAIPSLASSTGALLVLPYHGVGVLNEDRTAPTFNTPEMVQILEEWKGAYDSGAIAPGAVSKDGRNLPENLENRRVAFLVNIPATLLVNTQKNAPEVYADLVVTPGVRTPEGKLLLPGQQTFAIPSGSDNKATAADWLKFVTNAENQLEFCKIVAIYPSTKATLDDPYFDSEGDDAIAVARKSIVDTVSDLQDGALGTAMDSKLAELFNEQIRAYLQGDVDAQTALDTAEQQWTAELAR